MPQKAERREVTHHYRGHYGTSQNHIHVRVECVAAERRLERPEVRLTVEVRMTAVWKRKP